MTLSFFWCRISYSPKSCIVSSRVKKKTVPWPKVRSRNPKDWESEGITSNAQHDDITNSKQIQKTVTKTKETKDNNHVRPDALSSHTYAILNLPRIIQQQGKENNKIMKRDQAADGGHSSSKTTPGHSFQQNSSLLALPHVHDHPLRSAAEKYTVFSSHV